MNYTDRIGRFQKALAGQADLVFLPISADLNYLTGVPRDIPNFGAVLHPGMWLEGAWLSPAHAPLLTLPRMTAEFGGLGNLKGIELRILGDHDDPAHLLKELLARFSLPAAPRLALSDNARAETVIALQALLPNATFHSATALLNPLRRIKSEEEIAVMRRAGEITEAAFGEVLAQLKFGMTELDIVSEIDYQLRRHGSLGPSFTTSMYNSGPQHALIWGDREHRWHRPLNPPVALLFDFGAVYDGFCYDFGRTVAFGDPSPDFQRIFDLVMASQAAGVAALQAGQATAEQADAAARQVIIEGGYGPEFRHRLGHSIGMDVHEAPFLTKGDTSRLENGMLFTVEPSITRSADFSARVEDVVVVRPGGGEKLTTGYQSLFVVE
jgi:Xaa-Pro aminopeptidase